MDRATAGNFCFMHSVALSVLSFSRPSPVGAPGTGRWRHQERQVSESGFRIDLGVLHPEPGRGYILGVECDGAAYHSDRSARTRDVWRQEILERRGWVFYRVWSTRWWYHKAEEIDKLKSALERAITSP